MKKKFFVVAATCISSSIIAQQTQDSSKTKQLDEVVVTANKYPQKLSSTGKVLTVINRDQLEKNTGRTLAQVLNEQAGLVVNGAQGPLGTNLLVYMRGAGTANTLILIDGVPANDASGITAEFDINHLSIDQVERIEILKGAQSVLYGSDAVAGVINIITRKQTGNKPLAGNATLAGGSYGSFKGSAGIGGKHNKFDYKAQYSYLRSDGFSAAYDPTGTSKYDNDGYRQHLVAMNVGMQATDHWQLRAAGQYGEYKADIDDGGLADDKNNTIKNKNLQLTLSSVNQFSAGSLHVNLNLNNTNRELDDAINTPVGPNDYDPFHGEYKGKSVFAEAYSNLSLQKHIGMLLGVDYRGQKASIETTYGKLGEDSLTAHQESGYASLFVKNLSGFNAELGARYTHHSVFGSAFTYSFNPSYTIAEQVKLFANIASGFRAPSLYHLASEYGNARLQPEKSTSYEGGVQYINKGSTVNIRVNYFNRIIRDVIIFRSLPAPPYAQYDNADKQKDHGFELEATLLPAAGWSIRANYTYTNGKVTTLSPGSGKDSSYYNLYRRPKNTANLTLGYQASAKWYASLGFRWVDKRNDLYYNSNTFSTEQKVLAAYYNLDVYTSYQAASFVKIFADLRNITNRQYFDLYGYNSRRFNFMAGILLNF